MNETSTLKVNIFREIPWFGGNYFHPLYYDENVYRQEGSLRAGKSVPEHYHKYFDEHWTVVKGTPTFVIGKEKFQRKPGESFFGPMNIPHAIRNDTKEDVILITEMRPAADMPRMMSIIAGLQDDGEKNWMMKYLYTERRAGLKEFSTPTTPAIKIMTAMFMAMIMPIGRAKGWDRFMDKYL